MASGRGGEGDLVAEGLELADEVAGLAGGVEMAMVPVGTQILVVRLGVLEEALSTCWCAIA
ncbi:hypothetical protein WJ438_37680 [Streptomyces sp. GD-15H]|uniref:hypothetical protein n=1 Tax=Streptomyces sp. GD-15H TaxID=3129112 RepID=UPI003244B881